MPRTRDNSEASHNLLTEQERLAVEPLIAKIRAGDADAKMQFLSIIVASTWFEGVQQRYRSKCHRMKLGNHEVEDILIETLFKRVDSIPNTTVEDWAAFSHYYQNNLNNKISYVMIKEHVSATEPLSVEHQNLPMEASEEPDEKKTMQYEILPAAMQLLSNKQSDIFHKRFVKGQTQEEIADEYGVTHQRIQQIEFKGKKSLSMY